jgi:hypothetical protein
MSRKQALDSWREHIPYGCGHAPMAGRFYSTGAIARSAAIRAVQLPL